MNNGIITIPKATFLELWKQSVQLACPFTRGHPFRGAVWLFPFPSDPCQSKLCKFFTCHTFGSSWSRYQELFVPDVALTKDEILTVSNLESALIFEMLKDTKVEKTENEVEGTQFKAKYAAEVKALLDRNEALEDKLKKVKIFVESLGSIATKSDIENLRMLLDLAPYDALNVKEPIKEDQ